MLSQGGALFPSAERKGEDSYVDRCLVGVPGVDSFRGKGAGANAEFDLCAKLSRPRFPIEQRQQPRFVDHGNLEFLRLVQLRSSLLTGHHVIGLLAD